LNDFLPPEDRQRTLLRRADALGTVKDFIEAQGVPHTEVDLILVNGVPVGLMQPLGGGDRVSVYPAFRSIALATLPRLRSPRPPEVRFVLDVHLGRLAGYLRLLGFDAAYSNDCADEALAGLAHAEHRLLLTRDRELLKRRLVEWGYWVRETRPHRQLVEVVRRFDLASLVRPFSRCGRCNGVLEPVAKASVAERLPARTRDAHDEFHRCRACGQVYWRGSHVAAIERLIDAAVGGRAGGQV
jgi:uncharacterized protein with PIN domain